MLVLSRKEGERIVIGDNITLVISKVCGNRVTIGIDAPRDVKVVRGELQTETGVPMTATVSASISADEVEVAGLSKPGRATLRDFAASVLPLQRHVG